jgi:hypothetical protein
MQRQRLHRAGASAGAARIGLHHPKPCGDEPRGEGIEILGRSPEAGQQAEHRAMSGAADAQRGRAALDARNLIHHGDQDFSMFQ